MNKSAEVTELFFCNGTVHGRSALYYSGSRLPQNKSTFHVNLPKTPEFAVLGSSVISSLQVWRGGVV